MSSFDEEVHDSRSVCKGVLMSVSDRTSGTTDTDWIRACTVDEVAVGEAFCMPVSPPIAVFNVDGEFFATDDTCTHAQSSLSDGYIDGDVVECAFHFAKFCIRTGAALTRPAFRPLRRHEVRVSDGYVYVKINRG